MGSVITRTGMTTYRILIVDDRRDIRRVLRAGLETLSSGFQVIDVPSGEEAMLLTARQGFDLMVADVRLPGISGLELIRRAQAQNPKLRLILVTGVTDPIVRRQVTEAGADAYFFKPVEMPDFLDAVKRCLGMGQEVVEINTPPIKNGEPVTPFKSLSDRLASLRQDAGAITTILLNSQGSVLARAGELADVNEETTLIPDIMGALNTSARVSYALGLNPPEALLSFSGRNFDLYLTHVGQDMALVAVLPSATDEMPLTKIQRLFRPAVQDLLATLANLGVSLHPEEEEILPLPAPLQVAPAEEVEPEPALEALFQAGPKPAQDLDLDAFWDTLTNQDAQEGVINAKAISYEQAMRLGLTPGEEQK